MHFAPCAVYDPDSVSSRLIDRCKQVPGMLLDSIVVWRTIDDLIDNLGASRAGWTNPLNFVQPHQSAPALHEGPVSDQPRYPSIPSFADRPRAYKRRRRSAREKRERESRAANFRPIRYREAQDRAAHALPPRNATTLGYRAAPSPGVTAPPYATTDRAISPRRSSSGNKTSARSPRRRSSRPPQVAVDLFARPFSD